MPSSAPSVDREALDKSAFDYEVEAKRYRNPEYGRTGQQFCHLYHTRLAELAPGLKARATAKWPGIGLLNTISDANLSDCKMTTNYIVVGTVMKMFKKREGVFDSGKLRPDADQLTDRAQRWADEADTLALHDDTSSIPLVEIPAAEFVTGMVVALLGRKTSRTSGFVVREWCLPGAPPISARFRDPFPAPMDVDGDEDPLRADATYVGFMSGPLLSNKELCGELYQFLTSEPRLQHLVLAGNAYSNTRQKIQKGDVLFSALTSLVSIDLVPGFRDTHTVSFPQERPPALLFPECFHKQSFQGVVSPHDFVINKIRILCHSGEPIEDILRCWGLGEDPLKAMRLTLEARHLAPTAPDTLPCPSFKSRDPLLLESSPNVYVIGGTNTFQQGKFAHVGGGETVLLCVPDIRKQPAMVLVNTKDPADVVLIPLSLDEVALVGVPGSAPASSSSGEAGKDSSKDS